MIIWCASFPRSGNSLLSSLLEHHLGARVSSVYLEKDPFGPQHISDREIEDFARSNHPVFIKTHNLPADHFPAIYLVRDPRDVICSYAQYIIDRKINLPDLSPDQLHDWAYRTLIHTTDQFSGWKNHVHAWTHRDAPTIIIRYEDLVTPDKQLDILSRVIRELDISDLHITNDEPLPSFDTFRNKDPKFFRKGKAGGWKADLPERYQLQTWHRFRNEMKKYGYAGSLKADLYHSYRIVREVLPAPLLGKLHQHVPRPANFPENYFSVRQPIGQAPRISIVTPSFNSARFIENTICSVVSQGYTNLEYSVQDGNSSDDTLKIVDRYRKHITRINSRPDSGQAQAINRGFEGSTGEIMAYLNSDDMLLPGTLQYVASFFSTHPEVDVVYGHRLIIDETDRQIGVWILAPHSNSVTCWADYIPQETMFWRRSIWDAVGSRMDESFQFAMDWDLILRFQEAGARIVRLPRLLAAFRVSPAQKTSSQMSTTGEREIILLRKRSLGREVSADELSHAVRPYLYTSLLHHWGHSATIFAMKGLAKITRTQSKKTLFPARSIYFFSVHKAGTTLINKMLAQLPNYRHMDYSNMVFNGLIPSKIEHVEFGHLYGEYRIKLPDNQPEYTLVLSQVAKPEFVQDRPCVFLIRDPRDILISTYYSMGYSHVISPVSEISQKHMALRETIQSQTLDEFVVSFAPNLVERIQILIQLIEACSEKVVLKYEDLIHHPDAFFDQLETLVRIPPDIRQSIIAESRPLEVEDPLAHKRSGKTGQYLEKLKPETIGKLNLLFADILKYFDYPLN